ncbi:hypothetical protein E5676_scaffold522G001330 [Cucumis melo var. makuwa]|uniref:Retrotransposon gag domain-containing protein n=1 Tax=Cucumis melo var. makuwa TaxID=1194695 RepID=A0A5D3D6M2_CUCMM|nr:hypothetical protein E5676_scaffold522G001330 [Cucumis melo var. makuwa]
MRAMANQPPAGGAIPVSRVKIPEPKPFCGARDAKALENYIFDLEQYFRATNTVIEEAKVTLAMMHLSEDAKLWWRSRFVDMQEGRCTIDTWDALKRELRSQFFSENVEILARRKLRELKHTGSIRERKQSYMNKEFKTSRPRTLQPNGCLTCLTTLRMRDVIQVPHLEEVGTTAQVLLKLREGIDALMEIVGPINRILETSDDDQASLASDSDNQLSQTEREVDHTEEVDNPRMGALKLLSSLQKKVGETNTPVEMGLMYVDTWINQKPTKSTMVDSGATHNFITEAEAKRLNLHWEKDAGRMKVVNSAAFPIIGLVK